MPETRTCGWHKCQHGADGTRATFHPVRSDQLFCSTECRLSRVAWKQTRGAKIVDHLIANDKPAIERIRKELLEEISQ